MDESVTSTYISVSDLRVNSQNGRYGVEKGKFIDLKSERTAIQWILDNTTNSTRELLENILKDKRIHEDLLVQKNSGTGEYIVWDGNRRLTCLKLLANKYPRGIDTTPFDDILDGIHQRNKDLEYLTSIRSVHCRIENDMDEIKKIVTNRHGEGGKGTEVLLWRQHQKSKSEKEQKTEIEINHGIDIINFLIEYGHLDKKSVEDIETKNKKILSLFDKLFKSQEARKFLGIDVKEKRKVVFEKDEKEVINALKTVINLMVDEKIGTHNVYNEDEIKYLIDKLGHNEKINIERKLRGKEIQREITQKRFNTSSIEETDKIYLLPKKIKIPKRAKGVYFSHKFMRLHQALQERDISNPTECLLLSLGFRSYLEILTNEYLNQFGMEEKEERGLHKMIKLVCDDITQSKSNILESQLKDIENLAAEGKAEHSAQKLVERFHEIVHRPNIEPRGKDCLFYAGRFYSYIEVALKKIKLKIDENESSKFNLTKFPNQ